MKTAANNFGKVYIVGAGPGDPGLMTVRGLECVRQSDVIVHDRLVDRRVLAEARPGAEIIDAGKQPGHSRRIQQSIHNLLIAHAGEGRTVCRLKGGDPLVFGRGAEEAAVLSQAGIPFEIVPGVSCISAVPASAGIPITHRDYAHQVLVMTACRASDGAEDWSTAARVVCSGGTLIVLMGLARVASIAASLLENGCDGFTPAALVSSGTLRNQETRRGTLADISGKASGLQSPSLIVIGDVAALDLFAAAANRIPLEVSIV